MRLLKSSFFVVAAIAATQCFGAIYQVNSRSSLGIHQDPLNFPASEMPFVSLPSWAATVDTHPLITRMAEPNNAWFLEQSSGIYGTWDGNFFPAQKVVYVDAPTPPTTFFFATPSATVTGSFDRILVSGFGTQIQTKAPGAFTAEIRAYDTTASAWSPWFSVTGDSTGAADGSAVFIGIGSSARNISYVQIRAKSTPGSVAYGWWAVNAPNISLAPSPAPALISSAP